MSDAHEEIALGIIEMHSDYVQAKGASERSEERAQHEAERVRERDRKIVELEKENVKVVTLEKDMQLMIIALRAALALPTPVRDETRDRAVKYSSRATLKDIVKKYPKKKKEEKKDG